MATPKTTGAKRGRKPGSERGPAEDMDKIAARVKKLREGLEFGSRELARRAGLTHNGVWKIESGEAASMDLRTIQALAKALGVRPGWLIDGYGEPRG